MRPTFSAYLIIVFLLVGCGDEPQGGFGQEAAGPANTTKKEGGGGGAPEGGAYIVGLLPGAQGQPDDGTWPADGIGFAGCVKATCASTGANCGTIFDGCGGTISCGSCSAPATCGGGGQANVCGCSQKWTTEQADSVGQVGQWSSLAVDSKGGLHAVYFDVATKDLRYARKPAGKVWKASTVDSSGDVGRHAAVALDSAGGVHVVYRDQSKHALKYARLTSGGTWKLETVHKTPYLSGKHGEDIGLFPSLFVDQQDTVHVAYAYWSKSVKYGRGRHEILYTSRKAGASTWATPQHADSTAGSNNVGSSISIVADAKGGVFISYGRYNCNTYCTAASQTGQLVVLHRPAAGVWSNTLVDTSSTVVGGHSELFLDATGALHVAYRDETNGDLRYATRPSGGTIWQIGKVDGAGDVGRHASVAVDAMGAVHVAYYDKTKGALRYASRSLGGTWKTTTVDSGKVGEYASLALRAGPSGKLLGVHVTYFDAKNQDLKHAFRLQCQ